MKWFLFFALASACFSQGQPAASGALNPEIPDSTVVATFDDGTKFTMGDFRQIYYVLPPESQQMAVRDRAGFMHRLALMRKLTKMAESEGLQDKHPNKDALEFHRLMILSQAKINDMVNNSTVDSNDVQKYYDDNKDKYTQFKVRAIYLTFSASNASTNGKKPVSEEQARTTAEKLVADLRMGADFAKLVKQYSEDETSRAKDGDFATLKSSDNVPDQIKSAVFKLRQGEISDPIRQPNGFYIFRAEEVIITPFAQAQNEIQSTLRQQRLDAWLRNLDKTTTVTETNPAFFGAEKK